MKEAGDDTGASIKMIEFMSLSTAPLEGVVVLIVDITEKARQMEMALSRSGATVFVASGDEDCRAILTKVTPHAVIHPTVTGGSGPQSLAGMLFTHLECRTIVYSLDVDSTEHAQTKWLIDKQRPVSDVVNAIATAVCDPTWLAKGGDDVKPAF